MILRVPAGFWRLLLFGALVHILGPQWWTGSKWGWRTARMCVFARCGCERMEGGDCGMWGHCNLVHSEVFVTLQFVYSHPFSFPKGEVVYQIWCVNVPSRCVAFQTVFAQVFAHQELDISRCDRQRDCVQLTQCMQIDKDSQHGCMGSNYVPLYLIAC